MAATTHRYLLNSVIGNTLSEKFYSYHLVNIPTSSMIIATSAVIQLF